MRAVVLDGRLVDFYTVAVGLELLACMCVLALDAEGGLSVGRSLLFSLSVIAQTFIKL